MKIYVISGLKCSGTCRNWVSGPQKIVALCSWVPNLLSSCQNLGL